MTQKRIKPVLWLSSLFVLFIFLPAHIVLGINPQEINPDDQPDVNAILKQASQLVSRQGEHEGFWCDRVLLQIANLQIESGDFQGARNSIRRSGYLYGEKSALVDLAKAYAKAGQREQAFDLLNELGADHGWRQGYIEDGVLLCWIDHLIHTKELELVQETIDELKAPHSRPSGLCKLALAHTEDSKAISRHLYQNALTESLLISDDFSRAKALWEIIDSQLAAGQTTSATTTNLKLITIAETFENSWAKVCALREAAVRAAKMDDHKLATGLFDKAIDSRNVIDVRNKANALNLIAKAQVSVGFIDGALETARMIKHSEDDFTLDGKREEVLYEIAISQAESSQMKAAIATALSIEHFIQYQNDALSKISELQLKNGANESALATANQIANPSRKATAILKVATAFARAGDQDKAKIVANQIQLKANSPLVTSETEGIALEFTKAETWGITYDQRPYYTGLSHRITVSRAEELSASAMMLAQALTDSSNQNYAVAFENIRFAEIIQSLAHAHAATGDAKQAYLWASQIGSDILIPADNHDVRSQVEQRVHALIGVAEGLLARNQK